MYDLLYRVARVNVCAEHSSHRTNKCHVCLKLPQSVFWSHLACTSIFNLVPEYTHYVQLKQTTLGRGQRGRSSRGRDGSGDQPILQGNETGLTCGTSVRDSKKWIKSRKCAKNFLWWTFKCQIDYLPSMEQQEDGHRGGQTQYFYQMLSILHI